MHIQKKLDQPGALGYHTDDQNQPVSYVELTDTWTITVSHETLEMLADPYGSRPHGARLPEFQISDLGKFDKSKYGSLREWTDFSAREYRA